MPQIQSQSSSITSLPRYEATGSRTPIANSERNGEEMRIDFLKLLTKQMEFQDPMEPMDNTAFTAQLAQFSTLEEQQNTNKLLTNLLQTNNSWQANQSLNYLGRRVVLNGDQVGIERGQGVVQFNIDQPSTVNITLNDATGRSVRQTTVQVGAGDRSVAIEDAQLPDGLYTVSIQAEAANGADVHVTPSETGIVREVVNGSDGLMLEVNGRQVAISQIRRIG